MSPQQTPSSNGSRPPPRENPDLVGHPGAERTLLEAFRSGRLAHAWLICGRRGIGKATLAFRFARYVLARGAGEGDGGLFGDALPADEPDSLFVAPDDPLFRRVAAAGHADLLSVERTLNEKGKLRTEIIVDDVREIGSFLSLTAAEGGWRVIVVDCADEMNIHAANAVLKVLEEPPSRALMLLVSHSPGRLLPTIRSRCRRLRLEALDADTVAALVAKYRPGTPDDEAAGLARLSEGSIGRALSMAEEGGLDFFRDMVGLLETLPRLDGEALHRFADRVAKAGADEAFHTVSDLMRWWLGRLILFKAGKVVPDGGATADERALIERLSQTGSLDRWLEVWEKVTVLLARADGANLDRRQVVLNIFFSLETAVRPL